MPNIDDKIRWLLHAALRAERDGEERVASALRRMAEESRPLVPTEMDAALARA